MKLILLTTYVILLVILNVIQLAFLFTDPDYIHCTYVMLANCYVTVIGVVFATGKKHSS